MEDRIKCHLLHYVLRQVSVACHELESGKSIQVCWHCKRDCLLKIHWLDAVRAAEGNSLLTFRQIYPSNTSMYSQGNLHVVRVEV